MTPLDTVDVILRVLNVLLPVATGIAGWLVGRRRRDNNFLGDLQGSVNMLTEKNSDLVEQVIKLRDQIVDLRTENLELRKRQEVLIAENGALKQEVSRLKEENIKLAEQVDILSGQLANVKTITKTK